MMNAAPQAAPSLLMDLRPCYEGFAGIPQEVRLLFAMFARMGLPRFGGLASGLHYSHRHRPTHSPLEALVAQTEALIAQDTDRRHWPMPLSLLPLRVRNKGFKHWLAVSEAFRAEKLDLALDPVQFRDYLWMKLFDNTLPPADRPLLRHAEFYLTELGHDYARSLTFLPRFAQRRVHSQGWDLFLASSVSPYRVAPGTRLVVRYHDALPILSPHTVGAPWMHSLGHARMLQRNMRDGAHFICISEPVRQDLLSFFPEAEARVRTIPPIVAPTLFPDVREPEELRTILLRRASTATAAQRKTHAGPAPKLFLAVGTLEPRKNYLMLFRAFEQARTMTEQPIQLVVVANKGWRSDKELAELKRLVGADVHHLQGVPAEELRILYSMAHAVIAPSRAEGFDYSGAEAMTCGTPVLASEIPPHRWAYGDAADYFDPYSSQGLAQSMVEYAAHPRETGHLAEQSARGLRAARRFHPDTLTPVWEQALREIGGSASARTKMPSEPAMTS